MAFVRRITQKWNGVHKVIRFGVVGVINTCFSFGLYSFFVFIGMAVPLASLVALLIGIVFSFAMHGSLVFGGASLAAFFRFFAAWTIIYFANYLMIQGFIGKGMSAYLAGAAATLPTMLLSYVILNYVVFRRAVIQKNY